jgi:chromosome segregation ATPase
MKTQLRYKDEAAIVKRIDRYHAKLANTTIEIIAIEQKLSDLRLDPALDLRELDRRKDDRRKMERRADYIEKRLLRLKDRLATFRTPQLVCLNNGDISVPA